MDGLEKTCRDDEVEVEEEVEKTREVDEDDLDGNEKDEGREEEVEVGGVEPRKTSFGQGPSEEDEGESLLPDSLVSQESRYLSTQTESSLGKRWGLSQQRLVSTLVFCLRCETGVDVSESVVVEPENPD